MPREERCRCGGLGPSVPATGEHSVRERVGQDPQIETMLGTEAEHQFLSTAAPRSLLSPVVTSLRS